MCARLCILTQGRPALPSLRYLKLIREGAQDYGLSPEYQAWLASLQHYEARAPGQKLGSLAFKLIAFTTVFPVWACERRQGGAGGMPGAAARLVGPRLGHVGGVARAVAGGNGCVVRRWYGV
jgi:hypothetical protein